MKQQRVGIVIVTYGHERFIPILLDALQLEKQAGDQVVLLDNHPKHRSADIASKHQVVDKVIKSENVGFAVGSNQAAKQIIDKVDLLLFLNPDTVPLPGAIQRLRTDGRSEWAAWMGLLVLPDGKVNSAGNVVHISGLSWCDGYQSLTTDFTEPKEVAVLTGASVMVRAEVWKEVGGFAPIYFLYYEDTDLSINMLLRGLKLGMLPAAHVQHDYDFSKGGHKWFFIERNRYIFILRTWPTSIIVAMLPVLLAMEPALWIVALIQGRFVSKCRATLSFLHLIPQSLRERRAIQKTRTISAHQFLDYLHPEADSPLLGIISKLKPLNVLFRGYFDLIKLFIR